MLRVSSDSVIACRMYIRSLNSANMVSARSHKITYIGLKDVLLSQLDGVGWLWSGVGNR